MGRGFKVETATVPIVPGAIIFDLLNKGDKDWDENPYRALGLRALAQCRPRISRWGRQGQASGR